MWYSLVSLQQNGLDEMTATVTTDESSPWYSGHFPGDPILPGVAQLDMVVEVISALRQEKFSVSSLSRVKFRKPIRPGEFLDIHVATDKKPDRYVFQITSGQESVSSGMMIFNNNVTSSL